MGTSNWWIALAAVMLLVATYCVMRLATGVLSGRRGSLGLDGSHVAMGVAMAAMATPSLALIHLPARAWEVLFAVIAVLFVFPRQWLGPALSHLFGYRNEGSAAVLGLRHADHAVSSGAMVFMLARTGLPTVSGSMAGMSMAGMSMPGMSMPDSPKDSGSAGSGGIVLTAITVALLLYLLMSVGRAAERAVSSSRDLRRAGGPTGLTDWVLASPAQSCCEVVMAMAMVAMLVRLL